MPKFPVTFRTATALSHAVLLSALVGCAEAERLYIAHDIKLGIDASINTATSSGSLELGYDRRFLTYVPRSVGVPSEQGNTNSQPGASGNQSGGSDGEAKEAMSALACSRMQVGIVSIKYYDESLATGRAAQKFAERIGRTDSNEFDGNAKETDNSLEFFECFFREGAQEKESKSDSREEDGQ